MRVFAESATSRRQASDGGIPAASSTLFRPSRKVDSQSATSPLQLAGKHDACNLTLPAESLPVSQQLLTRITGTGQCPLPTSRCVVSEPELRLTPSRVASSSEARREWSIAPAGF